MNTATEECEQRQRRWNAAVLQQHLRRRARAGISTHPGDLVTVAHEMREEFQGTGSAGQLLEQALMDLVLMGLIVVTALPRGGSEWRPVDTPTPYGSPARGIGRLGVRS
jgi:hypothetical protein